MKIIHFNIFHEGNFWRKQWLLSGVYHRGNDQVQYWESDGYKEWSIHGQRLFCQYPGESERKPWDE
jgi:hypothetical protein